MITGTYTEHELLRSIPTTDKKQKTEELKDQHIEKEGKDLERKGYRK